MGNCDVLAAIQELSGNNGIEFRFTELRDWYVQSKCAWAPKWERVWAVAKTVRDKHTYVPRVFDEELPNLVYEVAAYCFRTFDPMRGQQKRSAEHKFLQLFQRKLWSVIANSRCRSKLDSLMGSLNSDILDLWMDLRKVALILWVREAVANLPEEDRDLIRRIYWEDETFEEVGKSMRIGKSTVGDHHERIINKLKNDSFGYVRLLDALVPGGCSKLLNN